LVAEGCKEIISPLTNFFSRRDEYAADAFSANLTKNPDALISGLIKLNSENLKELLPPKIYVIWNYSHPTLVERVNALMNRFSGK
ncbi:MAG: M48 family metalloprotease, partial [Treponemataceae bacterium]|nr:M48 family metalloprotease [Treponemataceae bacterium]